MSSIEVYLSSAPQQMSSRAVQKEVSLTSAPQQIFYMYQHFNWSQRGIFNVCASTELTHQHFNWFDTSTRGVRLDTWTRLSIHVFRRHVASTSKSKVLRQFSVQHPPSTSCTTPSNRFPVIVTPKPCLKANVSTQTKLKA